MIPSILFGLSILGLIVKFIPGPWGIIAILGLLASWVFGNGPFILFAI
jgi:hypothetical protein